MKGRFRAWVARLQDAVVRFVRWLIPTRARTPESLPEVPPPVLLEAPAPRARQAAPIGPIEDAEFEDILPEPPEPPELQELDPGHVVELLPEPLAEPSRPIQTAIEAPAPVTPISPAVLALYAELEQLAESTTVAGASRPPIESARHLPAQPVWGAPSSVEPPVAREPKPELLTDPAEAPATPELEAEPVPVAAPIEEPPTTELAPEPELVAAPVEEPPTPELAPEPELVAAPVEEPPPTELAPEPELVAAPVEEPPPTELAPEPELVAAPVEEPPTTELAPEPELVAAPVEEPPTTELAPEPELVAAPVEEPPTAELAPEPELVAAPVEEPPTTELAPEPELVAAPVEEPPTTELAPEPELVAAPVEELPTPELEPTAMPVEAQLVENSEPDVAPWQAEYVPSAEPAPEPAPEPQTVAFEVAVADAATATTSLDAHAGEMEPPTSTALPEPTPSDATSTSTPAALTQTLERAPRELPRDYVPAAESAHELYQLSVGEFEGPLDLLLFLIRRHELDIFDIPMAFICQQYLDYLKAMEELNIDVAAEFLYMASELVHIKSRMLLPPTDEEGEEEEAGDPRAELVHRLLEYQKYKDAAEQFGELSRFGRDVFGREPEPLAPPEGAAPLKEVGVFALVKAFDAMLKRQKPEVRHHVMLEQVSVRQRIRMLLTDLEGKHSHRFLELIGEVHDRIDVVVTFLALLEMCKLRLLKIYQSTEGELYLQPRFEDVGAATALLDGLDESQYAG